MGQMAFFLTFGFAFQGRADALRQKTAASALLRSTRLSETMLRFDRIRPVMPDE
jgi:hypothetical protein